MWSLRAVCLPTSHPCFLLGQHNLSSVSPAVGPAPADDSRLTTGNVTFLSFLVAWSSLVTWSGQWDMTESVGELLSRVFLTNQWDIFPHPHLSEGEHMSGAQQPLWSMKAVPWHLLVPGSRTLVPLCLPGQFLFIRPLGSPNHAPDLVGPWWLCAVYLPLGLYVPDVGIYLLFVGRRIEWEIWPFKA